MSGNTDQPTDVGQSGVDVFHLALQAADIGLWRWDLSTGAVQLTPDAAVLLGWSLVRPLDYAGFIAALHPDDRPVAERVLRNSVAAGGDRFDFEVRAAATGRRLRVRGQAFSGEDHAGEVAGILIRRRPAPRHRRADRPAGRHRDVLGRRDHRRGPRRDRHRLEPGAEVIMGYTAAEAIGKSLSMLLPRGQEDEMARLLERIKVGRADRAF